MRPRTTSYAAFAAPISDAKSMCTWDSSKLMLRKKESVLS